jgi:hypothetical protein
MSAIKKRRAVTQSQPVAATIAVPVAVPKPKIVYAVRICDDNPYDAVLLVAPIDCASVKRVKAAFRSVEPLDKKCMMMPCANLLACKLLDVVHQRDPTPWTLEQVKRMWPDSADDIVGDEVEPIDPNELITSKDLHLWKVVTAPPMNTEEEPTVLYQITLLDYCSD